jgi:hypothetical protein
LSDRGPVPIKNAGAVIRLQKSMHVTYGFQIRICVFRYTNLWREERLAVMRRPGGWRSAENGGSERSSSQKHRNERSCSQFKFVSNRKSHPMDAKSILSFS